MRKLREFLRLHFENKLSARAIGRSLKIPPSTAQVYVSRIRVAGLTWPLPPELDSDAAPQAGLLRDLLSSTEVALGGGRATFTLRPSQVAWMELVDAPGLQVWPAE